MTDRRSRNQLAGPSHETVRFTKMQLVLLVLLLALMLSLLLLLLLKLLLPVLLLLHKSRQYLQNKKQSLSAASATTLL